MENVPFSNESNIDKEAGETLQIRYSNIYTNSYKLYVFGKGGVSD